MERRGGVVREYRDYHDGLRLSLAYQGDPDEQLYETACGRRDAPLGVR